MCAEFQIAFAGKPAQMTKTMIICRRWLASESGIPFTDQARPETPTDKSPAHAYH
jgi:hypothetical protein